MFLNWWIGQTIKKRFTGQLHNESYTFMGFFVYAWRLTAKTRKILLAYAHADIVQVLGQNLIIRYLILFHGIEGIVKNISRSPANSIVPDQQERVLVINELKKTVEAIKVTCIWCQSIPEAIQLKAKIRVIPSWRTVDDGVAILVCPAFENVGLDLKK